MSDNKDSEKRYSVLSPWLRYIPDSLHSAHCIMTMTFSIIVLQSYLYLVITDY